MIVGKESYKAMLVLGKAALSITTAVIVIAQYTAFTWIVGSIFAGVQGYALYKEYKKLEGNV